MKTIRMFAAGFMVALSFLGCRLADTHGHVYQGKSSSWVSERKDLVFSVSADKTGLTCMFDRIYSTSSPNKYVDLKGLTLTAETIQ